MIYTITFNPTLDYAIAIDELRPYAFQRADDTKMAPGGKGINTAIILNRLEIPVTAIGFLGGHTGSVILNGLQKEGVKTKFIPIEGVNRINIKFYHPEARSTSVNTPGPFVSEKEIADLFRLLENIENKSYVVISGNITRGMPDDIYRKVMRYLNRRDVRIIVDAEARFLRLAMEERPFLVKPNATEFEDYFQLSSGQVARFKKADYSRYLKEMILDGAQNVALTVGDKGAYLMDSDFNLYHAPAPQVKVVSDVGAGDSFVAGFLASYIEHEDLKQALEFGVLCGAATATTLFQASKEDIEKLIK